ncbi:helix-turn-helix domain-containing protein [Herbaspirillum sp. LeCh32-8]|uniref:helix-turn-helix domain-containing protein n=1 Tax=Herbaspirillum sp. LeCh32-8 TaxID=2821356 RepID=UPI001AE484BE|nr:helix-turn-helix domain-containing protein [Herbaspirillum sp. LeCh32-8]MBP0599471.1 helix-turn-helix domain-containing protein [Herbaspirillum sp. LeCh32-8]
MISLQDIGARIRAARKARNLTAIELADRAGMHRNTLLALETGKGNIELGKLLSLCSELELELLLVPQQAADMRAAEHADQAGSQTELAQRLQQLMQQGERP